ncbi:hypothetical protein BDW42DRAFT_175247 [Aspergillus taichungensis]|uniref:Uncharacterized protein n=1 Tax=Aspergillus taichungensis TaxID=482145 RepID=A0A2J5HM70_9EURO|nr:hypothetical protein BDW42DRAFT_175247 [Aspergillus taichungensis]
MILVNFLESIMFTCQRGKSGAIRTRVGILCNRPAYESIIFQPVQSGTLSRPALLVPHHQVRQQPVTGAIETVVREWSTSRSSRAQASQTKNLPSRRQTSSRS